MELLVNGVQIQMDEYMPKEVDALVETVVRRSQTPPGSIVSEILADGRELVVDTEQGAPPVTVEAFNKLEIKIEPAGNLLQKMLEDGLQFCVAASEKGQKVGSLFRKLDMEAANLQFAALLEQFSVFVQFIDGLRDFTKNLYNNMEYKDNLLPIFKKLSVVLTKGNQAQNNQDWIFLADVLQYELPEIMGEFIGSFDNQWGAYQRLQVQNGKS